MDPQQLRELIDACRAGGDDLRAPEMAALADRLACDAEVRAVYERSQRLDAALGAAFRDASPPPGLEQRLLAAVGAADEAATVEKEEFGAVAPAPNENAPPVERKPHSGWLTRRKLAFAAAAASLLIAGLVGYSVFSPPREITRTQLVGQAQEWVADEDFPSEEGWKPVTDRELRIFPTQFINAAPTAWRRFDAGLDRRATVFRIPVRNRYAYLAVLDTPTTVTGLGRVPPRTPLPGASGGWRIGAWTKEGKLYVLLFGGVRQVDEGDYRSLLRSLPTA